MEEDAGAKQTARQWIELSNKFSHKFKFGQNAIFLSAE